MIVPICGANRRDKMTVAFIQLSDIHFGQEKGSEVIVHNDVKECLIEDAAEALGSRYKGAHVGSRHLAALSFNGNKIVTTGGGGAVLCPDKAMTDKARHLTTTARVPDPFEHIHDEVGYNYRLPNINAAMGCAQLEQLPGFLAAKRRLAETYAEAFAGVEGVRFSREQAHASSNYWLNAIVLEPNRSEQRDDVLRALHRAGFLCRPAWRPMHRLPMYADCPKMPLDTAEDLQRRIINLPSGARLAAACQALRGTRAMASVAQGPS
ncbi:MAG: DegT/DnrJ/EryC1/StrS family aminotransferase [Proteobacteria bacterium]|nr:DegT/DnrJ/EryC1/StrS family aminotransferase [Pseudomonadota bacterium]